MAVWLVLFLTHVNDTPEIRDTVDLIEINHYYDDHGKRVFEQIIFWDWSIKEGRWQVRAWRALKTSGQLPYRDWRRGGNAAIWNDNGKLRDVRAANVLETWTQYDPEFEDRKVLPVNCRNGLRK